MTNKLQNLPHKLKEVPNPPETLYYRGSLEALNYDHAVAVVGTRRCSEYGIEATKQVTKTLAEAGVTIISGLARGIDTIAHKTALEYGAPTIAVLGSGVEDKSIYPATNKQLANDIIKSGGLVMSEYTAEDTSWASNFPARNRIVASLADATVVAEAPLKSGALITARLAKKAEKEVYAVPGSVFSRLSEGANWLLQNGAKTTTTGKGVLKDLGVKKQTKQKELKLKLSPVEKEILETVAESPDGLHIDKITQKVKVGAGEEVVTSVMGLVIQGLLKETKPNCYVKAT